MRFHHIGIACRDISETLEFINKSFAIEDVSEIIFDEIQNVELCLVTVTDGPHIELVAGKTVEKFLTKKQFLYHTCWQVNDIEQAIEKLYENGAMLISAPQQAILFDNKRVAFLFSDIGIIELLEETASAL